MNNGRIYPKVYLAIDNCFASKRWTSPAQWMPLIQKLGINHVEASADNECDPLYSTKIYLKRWLEEIGEESVKTGVKVCNLYSGHGTYATLGLAHPDISVRDKMQHEWLIPMIDLSSRLKAGLGFYCHAGFILKFDGYEQKGISTKKESYAKSFILHVVTDTFYSLPDQGGV
jgi:D-erythrulose 1-phosphate 3-epimerase